MRIRVGLVFVVMALLWVAVFVRLAYIQVLPNQRLSDVRKRQFETVVTLQARRGDILDRNGQKLATSLTSYSLFADPRMIKSPHAVSRKIARLFGHAESFYYEKIKNPQKRFTWIERKVSDSIKDEVKSWEVPGLGFVEESKRIYPNDRLAAQVLGFVGTEGAGLDGVEARYEEELQGNLTRFNVKRDARGRPVVVDGKLFSQQPDGMNLELTIDRELQFNLEQELARAQEEFRAAGGMGVILDPKTSEILAMASLPGFDPNSPQRSDSSQQRNRTVTDPFEPGSTIKTFTMAAGISAGWLQPNSQFFCENGELRIGNNVIHEAESKHKFGFLTTAEILQKSSNIGAYKIAQKIGPVDLAQTLKLFGFGEKTGVDVSGESRGQIPVGRWSEILLSNVSFGQGISATALQIANAYAAIANGGTLHKPYIVKSITAPESDKKIDIPPQILRRVLSEKEAATLTYMLMGVTSEEGSGKKARVPGFPVAGKTGTAQKTELGKKGYSKGAFTSSFVGFIPANDPKYVIFVSLDQPQKDHFASEVAAPLFSRIATYAVRKAAIPPTLLVKASESKHAAKISQLHKRTKSAEMGEKTQVGENRYVPAMVGLTLREVLQQVRNQNLAVVLHGEGVVSRTEPEAGGEWPKDKRFEVYLAPAKAE